MDNPLDRFAVERGKIRKKTEEVVVDPRLFEPNKQLLLSVQRIGGLTCAEIKETGIGVVREHRSAKHLYGWAKFPGDAVSEIGLEIDDDPPPSLHSNIKGWPEKKEKRATLRRELARKSKPVLLEEKIAVSKDD